LAHRALGAMIHRSLDFSAAAPRPGQSTLPLNLARLPFAWRWQSTQRLLDDVPRRVLFLRLVSPIRPRLGVLADDAIHGIIPRLAGQYAV
jgi:hypothetical protein